MMPTFTVSLTYSYRVEGSGNVNLEASDKLDAEKRVVEATERAALGIPGANDFDVSDISVVEVGQ